MYLLHYVTIYKKCYIWYLQPTNFQPTNLEVVCRWPVMCSIIWIKPDTKSWNPELTEKDGCKSWYCSSLVCWWILYHFPRVAITSTDMGNTVHDQLFVLVRNGIEVVVGMAPTNLLLARVNFLQCFPYLSLATFTPSDTKRPHIVCLHMTDSSSQHNISGLVVVLPKPVCVDRYV